MLSWKNANPTSQSFPSFLDKKEVDPSSLGKFFAFRLRPHEDLKNGILNFARRHAVTAGAVVSCVGSLEQFSIRFANQTTPLKEAGHFEILSLTGTFSNTSAHLHVSVANKEGKVCGGHLMDESLIFTTAEIVVVTLQELEFSRELDQIYGYQELSIKKAAR